MLPVCLSAASVYQMLRGAEMLFAAAFAVFFLHRKLNRFHYFGIMCCMVSGRYCYCYFGIMCCMVSERYC